MDATSLLTMAALHAYRSRGRPRWISVRWWQVGRSVDDRLKGDHFSNFQAAALRSLGCAGGAAGSDAAEHEVEAQLELRVRVVLPAEDLGHRG